MPTFERLIRTLIPILIWMRQQTQLPISLLDLRLRCAFFQSQHLVERSRGTFPHSYHRRLLLNCVFSVLIALIVVSAFGNIAIRSCVCA